MKAFQKSLREFKGYNTGQSLARLFDHKPLQCSLYVTDRCNLDCAYCTEYDNSQSHPHTRDLKKWIRKIRDLGTMRIALVGGEPLLHPDIMEIIAFCRSLGFATSLTTNGFLLTPQKVKAMEEAGLQVMQISVDRMTPSAISRKSFKTLLPKLPYLKQSSIRVHITGVLCEDTLPESREVLETGMQHSFPTEVRLVHADPGNQFRVAPGHRETLLSFLEEMVKKKRAGQPIHTNQSILRYQQSLLRQEHVEWTCQAGYKLFFVSAQGQFWTCSMVKGHRSIMEITSEDLKNNNRKKSCQDGCGVYCAVSTSMVVQNPLKVIGNELLDRSRRVPAFFTAKTPKPAPAV